MTRSELIEHIQGEYGVSPDYPFPGDAESCVFRHAGNRKWFGLLMRVSRRRLGAPDEGMVDILNVKSDPLLIGAAREKPGICPAYHMNKDHWLSLLLDGTAAREDVITLVDISYQLTRPRHGKGRSAASGR